MLNANERLTHEHANGGGLSSTGKPAAKYWTNAAKAELTQRLGEYEDTGCAPEDIRRMLKTLREFLKEDEA